MVWYEILIMVWNDMGSSLWYDMVWYGILIMVWNDMGSSLWYGMIRDPDYGMV